MLDSFPSLNIPSEDIAYWNHIEPMIDGLLDELKTDGYVRLHREASGLDVLVYQQLLEIMERANSRLDSYRAMQRLHRSDAARFFDFLISSNVGFTYENVVNISMSCNTRPSISGFAVMR